VLTEVKGSSADSIYQWHPFYIDALAVRMRSNDTQFFSQDAKYNVTAAVNVSTGVQERYSYTPYGEVTFLNADFSAKGAQSSAINNVLYTGRERDPERGIQINRERYYDPPLGRWLTRDPIGYDAGTVNLYESLMSRPAVNCDPSGFILLPSDEFGSKSCMQWAKDTEIRLGNIDIPGGEGQYRHCLASCCLRKRHGGILGSLLTDQWNYWFEYPNDPTWYGDDSRRDMAAEESGLCAGSKDQSCIDGCRDALKNPNSPCARRPRPRPPVPAPCPRWDKR
jgi:RHS repeat-associated protein